MAATATELTSRWENLIGFGYEGNFGVYATPTIWLPCKELLPIEDNTELITPATPVGRLLPTASYPRVFGLRKGKSKLTCVVPWCDGIALLLSKSLAKVTTAGIGTPPPYSHILEPFDAAGYALSRSNAGISLTKINGEYTETLAGCRIVGFKLTQKQNAPLELALELEGGAHGRGESSSLAPAITFAQGATPTMPYVLFSHVAVKSQESPSMSVQELEFEVKFKATTGDGQQPLGNNARTRLDIIGLQAFCRFKRVFAYDNADDYRSLWQELYERRENGFVEATWTGPVVSSDTHSIKVTFGDSAAHPCGVQKNEPKIADDGGVITEEVELEAALIDTAGSDKFPFWLTIVDGSATPATWPV